MLTVHEQEHSFSTNERIWIFYIYIYIFDVSHVGNLVKLQFSWLWSHGINEYLVTKSNLCIFVQDHQAHYVRNKAQHIAVKSLLVDTSVTNTEFPFISNIDPWMYIHFCVADFAAI